MQDVVAPVQNITFDIEIALNNQLGAQPLPFPGMDTCPFRHVKGEKTVVCKHWLRGLCKKGDDCEFLHEFDMTKMPECFFFSKYGQCNNKECPFLHIDPAQKMKDCAWSKLQESSCEKIDLPELSIPTYDLPVPDQNIQTKKMMVVCHSCGEIGHKSISCPKMWREGPLCQQMY
ncbi:CPSF4-like protein [Mya arenaria]|uniref:Cleavage and polyadenylation specificity factor subunit 4 n=1 Tax=Mya arenaria TaxID=6604 RepID=A0ABY7DDK4_MYAAR|nr:CPSF4-like protein [Mya arenaria]